MSVHEWMKLQEPSLNSGGNVTCAKMGENHQCARGIFLKNIVPSVE